MYQVVLKARASNTTIVLKVAPHELALTVLEFLRQKGYPIASSCSGEGICRKCIVCGDILSCEKTVKYFVDEAKAISVDYL